MPAIISEKFRIFNAKQFIESIAEGSDAANDTLRTMLYFFVGRPQRWDAYLEIFSKTSTAINVGDVVYVGANLAGATFKGTVRQVFEDSLLLHSVGGSANVNSVPTVGSDLKVGSTKVAETGVYRYGTDEIPPAPLDNQTEKFSVHDDVIAAKRITSSFMRTVITRYNWLSNSVYDMWKPDYHATATGRTGKTAATGATDIATAKFYALNTDEYSVWKCLQNSNGAQSTEQPSLTPSSGTYNSSTGIFTESGGVYAWKHMYTIPTNDVVRFLATDFMPIAATGDSTRTAVEGLAVDGAIDAYVIEDGGNPGVSNGTYYVKVDGDGSTDAVAKVTVSGGAITKVEPQVRGVGYTYASINWSQGNVYTNVGLSSAASSVAPASIEVIIPPRGGHGSDLELELNGKRVMTNIRIASIEGAGDFPVDNDFRRIGLIQDVKSGGARATADTLNGVTSLRINGASNDYVVDEVVTQTVTGGTAKGTVVSWERDNASSNNGVLRIFQSPDFHKDSGVVRSFSGSNAIVGQNETAATIDTSFNGSLGFTTDANGNVIVDTSATGSAVYATFSSGIASSEIDSNTGDVIYIENRRLITRALDQIEDIKLVVEF